MNNILLALIVGLGAGVAGGFVAGMARPAAEGIPGTASARGDADASVSVGSLANRLERIEALLGAREEAASASLRGSVVARPEGSDGAAESVEALVERLDARVREAVAESVRKTWEELGTPGTSIDAAPTPAKKEATLAEAARELGLSAAEEDEVRRIHEATTQKVIALLASEEDGGEEAVRRDFEAARAEPAKQAAIAGKYMGRLMGNLGGFIQLGLDHDARLKAAIGAEKAQRLDAEFEITDLDPYGLDDMFTFGN